MYCEKCGYKLTGKEKYCPKCGGEVNGSDKGRKPEKQGKRHKSIRGIVIFVCVLVILIAGLILYFYFNRTKEENDDVQVQSETAEIEENTRTKSETEEINYQGMVMDYRYLDKDELFCLKLTNDEMVYVDLNGKVQQPDKLNSDYLDTEAIANDDGRVYDTEIYDINGNNVGDRFIKDSDHEQLLGICRMDDYDVVCVLSFEETPSSSLAIVKVYDEKGNELCRVDSDNEYFKNGFETFKRFDWVEYAGDTVCRIVDSSDDRVFSINVETGELLSPTGNFSDGYAVVYTDDGKKIQDLHGNYATDLSGEEFEQVMDYSNGMFMSLSAKAFYDLNLNKVIDLSQYNPIWIENADVGRRRDWREADGEFVFKDGFCNVWVKNESGTDFRGIIDTSGNWVIELSDTQTSEYKERISRTKIRIGSQIYDLETKSYTDLPSDMNEYELVNGRYYYINDYNEFSIFTADDAQVEQSEVKTENDDSSEKTITKSSGSKYVTDENVADHIVDFNVMASSVLRQTGYNYEPRNMTDLDMTTCWSDGVTGNGVGEYVIFSSNSTKSVNGFAIAPGFKKSEDLFIKNGAPLTVFLEYTGPEIEQETLMITIEDYEYNSGIYYFDFDEEKEITECKVTILKVRDGNKYDDCCISEMFLYC